MKKIITTLTFAVIALAAMAVPAKKGHWQTLRLADGKEVKAQLVGDEHIHFWQTEKGDRYVVEDNGTATPADIEQMTRRARQRRASIAARQKAPHHLTIGEQTHYTGQKKGIVILMQFQDTKFKTANDKAKYCDILNKENYITDSFKGSVADYFKAQSGGIFQLTFDVAGPYTADNNASYYGANDSQGNDLRPDELIVEALKAANSEVNFQDYDWDGDGEVDQVFVLYAGKGEADGGAKNTIWPHMWYLENTSMAQTLDGVRINTYACANEIMYDGSIEGIGNFCHEFSHCLGFPDFYDTSYSGWHGTGEYDLMCGGSYNGNTFQPAGYTAYEKWMAGWLQPVLLDKEGVTVENMKPLSNGGEAYIIYNDGNKNEYYMIENRQPVAWDASLPGKGLMITHIDFDSKIWQDNNPNTKITSSEATLYGLKVNDHQRYSLFCADNSVSDYTQNNDLYPYGSKNSLTDTSTPKASLYNKNTDGTKLMHKPVTQIKQNADMTMSFQYNGGHQEPDTTQVVPVDTTIVIPVDTIPVITIRGDTIFYESFDQCNSTGGNDGKWSGQIASSTVKFDNQGWDYLAAYAANHCARFGNGSKIGNTTTPEFNIDGEAILTFKAAAWDTPSDGNLLKVQATNGVTPSISQLTMPKGQWADYTITLTGNGKTKLTFSPENRFFLDEVLVKKPQSPEPPIDYDACDLNGDGKLDTADIIILIKAIANKHKETKE